MLPVLAALPMLVPAAATSLYLTGIDAFAGIARWDAAHPEVFYGSFAAALALNVAAVVEGVHRYRVNHDANERRRIRMAVYTGVPGVLAYAVKDGVPIVAQLFGAHAPVYPTGIAISLQALVLLPAFGMVWIGSISEVRRQHKLRSQTRAQGTALAARPGSRRRAERAGLQQRASGNLHGGFAACLSPCFVPPHPARRRAASGSLAGSSLSPASCT